MMAQVIKQPDRYLTTPPDIMLIPKAYINVIKKSYKYSEYNLIEFLKAIEVTLFDLRKEVVDTIDELNRHEKIR